MDDKLISIIIPCYNCEQWLPKIFESLIKQTSKNFEIIFINDGSSDNSLVVARKVLKDSNLNYKIIDKKNEGVSVARNIGISNSKGDYLYFLDADDTVELNLCEKILETFEKEDIDMMFFDYKIIDENNISCYDKRDYKNYFKVISSEFALSELLRCKFKYHMCAFAIKSKVVIENNLTFEIGAKYGEDHEFIIKSLCNSNKVIVTDYDLFNYHMRDNSATSQFSVNRIISSINSANRVYKYINNFYNSEELNKLGSKYISGKIMYNLDYLDNLDSSNPELKQLLYKEINKNKEHIKYYYKSDRINLIGTISVYISPKIFLNYIKIKKILLKQIKKYHF